MSRPRTRRRTLKRWILWPVGIVLVVCGLYVALLTFPQMLVRNSVSAGPITVYYDTSPRAEVEQLAQDVDERLRATDYYDAVHQGRVFYLRSQKLYSLFVRLSGLASTPLPQGFALSATGNAFVCEPRLLALSRVSGRQPKFSIWEGSPAHTIAHEIGHLCVTGQIGRSAWKALPLWKQEGLPEYIANIGVIRADSSATLAQRIDVLNTDRIWRDEFVHDRILYEAGLLVEFLIDVQGYTQDEILDNGVTKQATLAAMMSWRTNAGSTDKLSSASPLP